MEGTTLRGMLFASLFNDGGFAGAFFLVLLLPSFIFSFRTFFLTLMFGTVAFFACLPGFVAPFFRLPVGLFDLRFVFF